MNNPRIIVDNALFQLLKGSFPWNYASMHFLMWDKVDSSNQPAMFLRRTDEIVTSNKGSGNNRYELKYILLAYIRVDNTIPEATNPYAVIDPILDAVDKALLGTPGIPQMLGGLVGGARIDGRIAVDDGVVDGQAVLMIPISVFTGS
jgi:hypothetical protein